jgi:putative copper export protein
VLAIKMALAALALGWGGLHRLVVRPMLERGVPPTGLSRSLLGEGAVGMAVLLVAAVLVNANPPQRPGPSGVQTAGTAR